MKFTLGEAGKGEVGRLAMINAGLAQHVRAEAGDARGLIIGRGRHRIGRRVCEPLLALIRPGITRRLAPRQHVAELWRQRRRGSLRKRMCPRLA